ncbi:helix-turn-helix transcriptional regulator [Paenibacillus sp. sptzw28]|uniref:winged helix-turn-helix transcriptional regulator n=1 Tax=Paenibacillus sp. sptzw28 TaxID=715179 RepID=UPI001C6F2568|nr:helix-turn-helix domain-containing protein [Paenibacillus sp. sptzw28]QYR23915.1 helix-turn-helix transcriptional regulator [Paenibacillus sp. sptzw28]
MQVNQEREKCPIEISLDVIGGKWKVLILWYLLWETRRFSQLERLIPQVSQKVLAEKLRELEESGLIERRVYPVVPPRVEYSLTEGGQSIRPLLMALLDWGNHYKNMNEDSGASTTIRPCARGSVSP